MNILNISTFDSGGAATYARQMNKLFNLSYFTSKLVVRYGESSDEDIVPLDYIPKKGSFDSKAKKTKRFFLKQMNGISRKKIQTNFDYYFFQDEKDEYISATTILKSIAFKPDVIFLYWISEFITSKTIKDLYNQTGARIYWLMMDNAPITGGCHYPWDCKGYQTDCSNCPAIVEQKFTAKAAENLKLKQNSLPPNLSIIAFSEEDFVRAKSSSVGQSRRVIKRLGFITDNFKPGNKDEAKKHFNISSDTKVIFFGASKMNEKRKGMDPLVRALSHLSNYFAEKETVLLYAGHQIPEVEGLNLKHVGFLKEDELILAYQAADVFACPSIEDSGPMMINQSIMCGTPVVAFDTGVALDLVITGHTGYRARKNDFLHFAEGIKHLLELTRIEIDSYSDQCRKVGVANCGNLAFQKFCNEILLPV